jgi:hypothetical protein
MLWDHVLYEEKVLYKENLWLNFYFFDWEITEYIKHNISL